jgi:hypothetical protein
MEPVDPRVPPSLVPPGSRATVIAKDQPQYIPLPSILTPDAKVITRWHLTPAEREAVMRGEDIYLTIWGTPIRPVLLSVGPLDWTQM